MQKFAHVEKALNWGPAARQCGPAFVANASRNFVMSATSFVITPTLYRDYVPQEHTLTLTPNPSLSPNPIPRRTATTFRRSTY